MQENSNFLTVLTNSNRLHVPLDIDIAELQGKVFLQESPSSWEMLKILLFGHHVTCSISEMQSVFPPTKVCLVVMEAKQSVSFASIILLILTLNLSMRH